LEGTDLHHEIRKAIVLAKERRRNAKQQGHKGTSSCTLAQQNLRALHKFFCRLKVSTSPGRYGNPRSKD